MKLNQAIAILNSVKADAKKATTKIYQLAQKSDLFSGISRTYEPAHEDGFNYPSEQNNLQLKSEDLIKQFSEALIELFDIAATQDWGNTQAIADVVVGDKVILTAVPVSYLLFLEKQLTDIKTFVLALPIQDISEEWIKNSQLDCYSTEPKYTTKTKRVVKPVVLYEATKEHPAQVKEASEDIPEGKWKTVKFTGAITRSQQNDLIKRVDLLSRAVVFARETANSIEVTKKDVATPVFSYLFGL